VSDIYLVRHGQASFGTSDYDRLSPLGHEQAELLARHFLALGRRVDAFYSGPLRRQRETAQIMAAARAAPAPVILEGLAEYDADLLIERHLRAAGRPRPEATDRRGYQALLESTGEAWITGELGECGESFAAFRGRVALALEAIRQREGRGRSIVAVASAGVIGAALGHVLGLGDREALAASWVVHNSAVTLIRYDERRMALATFNGVAHLELPSRPELLTYR
jgi:broad specificity phosphatase PhoE